MKRILFVLIFAIFTVSIFAGLSGKVAEVDKYGNTYTDLLQDSATEAGLEFGDIVELAFGDHRLVVPFVRNYGDVDRGQPLLRISGGCSKRLRHRRRFRQFPTCENGRYRAQHTVSLFASVY